MGKSMSAIKQAKQEQKVELEERLNFLETTTTEKMKVKLQQMLHGSDNDLQIHGGTVVEQHIRVKIDASSHENELKTQLMNYLEETYWWHQKHSETRLAINSWQYSSW